MPTVRRQYPAHTQIGWREAGIEFNCDLELAQRGVQFPGQAHRTTQPKMGHGILVVSCNSGAPCQDRATNRFTRGIRKAKNKLEKGNVSERAQRRCEMWIGRRRS